MSQQKGMQHQETVDGFLEAVAKASRSALLLDYDGTLAPFEVDRQRAFPYPGLTHLLQQIVDTGRTRLVIVTGRDAREIDPFLRLSPPPEVWGSHGLQRLLPDGSCEMPDIPVDVAEVLGDARRWLDYQGLHHLAEVKPGSIAVHWRALEPADADELRGKILVGWFPIADRASLKLLEFDGGVEMRMPDLDKGDAIRTVLKETSRNAPVAYLGDDLTDERAFRALGSRGLSILVRTKPRRTAAQVWLKPPDELLDFLSRWLAATETTQLARSATY
ncbi:MAG TPA: trehalose-phosphatase [Candidatus Sulfotelmatobacter sp.]|nr:trehalose-phosphatase [Candidatus Sulfotelmatobacter sp.]